MGNYVFKLRILLKLEGQGGEEGISSKIIKMKYIRNLTYESSRDELMINGHPLHQICKCLQLFLLDCFISQLSIVLTGRMNSQVIQNVVFLFFSNRKDKISKRFFTKKA